MMRAIIFLAAFAVANVAFAATKQERAAGMHHIASVTAVTVICKDVEMNKTLIALLAAGIGIKLAVGTKDFRTIQRDMLDQVSTLKDSGTPEQICAIGMMLYGPNGANVPNLLHWK